MTEQPITPDPDDPDDEAREHFMNVCQNLVDTDQLWAKHQHDAGVQAAVSKLRSKLFWTPKAEITPEERTLLLDVIQLLQDELSDRRRRDYVKPVDDDDDPSYPPYPESE